MSRSNTTKRDTVIFDMDGTLLNTLEDLTASVNYCLRSFNYPEYSSNAVRGMLGNGIYPLFKRALPNGESDPAYEKCIQLFENYYKNHLREKTMPYPGIYDMLRSLKLKEYHLGIVSNKFDAAVKGLVKDFFTGYISVAIGETPVIAKKPAPDTVLRAMQELRVGPEQCLFVGDSEVDIQTAANAGIPCISVDWGFKTKSFLQEHGASVIVSSPDELLKTILEWK